MRRIYTTLLLIAAVCVLTDVASAGRTRRVPRGQVQDVAIDFDGAMCGTDEIAEDQGAAWACIATPLEKTGGTMAGNIIFNDSVCAAFGTGSDGTICYDGTNLLIDPQAVGSGYTDFTGAIFVSEDEDTFSQFGAATTTVGISDAADRIVANKVQTGTTGVRRAGIFITEVSTDSNSTNGQNFGMNAFVFTDPDNSGNNTRTTKQGGGVGGRFSSRHEGAGTWSLMGGISSQAEISGADEDGTITTGYGFMDEGGDGGAGAGGIGDYRGFWIRESTGNITTKYGIYIEDLENATNNYNIRLDGASVYNLWLANDSGTSNDGIWFGAAPTPDVNLYRSGAGVLTTDHHLRYLRNTISLASGSLTLNSSHLGTGSGADYNLPADGCDGVPDYGNWVTLTAEDAAALSLTVSGPEDTINYSGLALDADDELDSAGNIGDSVTVECLTANNWYATRTLGPWADGGVAD